MELTLSQKRSIAGQKGGYAKKGKISPKTLERREALRLYKERVLQQTDKLLEAQIALATGSFVVFRIDIAKDKKNRPVRVTDEAEIHACLCDDYDRTKTQYHVICIKESNIQAIESLLNRAFGRPAQSIQIG